MLSGIGAVIVRGSTSTPDTKGTPMRRTHPSVLTTLLITIGVTLLILVPLASRAEAADHQPSCSLHPTQHDTAGWIFENHNHERRFLTATAADGAVLFNDWLYPITQVGDDPQYSTPQPRQTPLLVGLVHVNWAGDSYDVTEYADPTLPEGAYCAGQPVTTTAPPTTTATPPTVPLAPPTTAPPVTQPPSTTPPPASAPPTTEPPISCLDGRCETLTVATCTTDGAGNGVRGAIATRAAPLPITGSSTLPLSLLGLGLLGGGTSIVALGRRSAVTRR